MNVEILKRAIGYEKETNCCNNCSSFDASTGKCRLNPTFPWAPSRWGICDNYEGESQENQDE